MIIIGDNFFDGLQVVFGTMLVWSEVSLRARAASRRSCPASGTASCPWCVHAGHPVADAPVTDGSPVAGASLVGGHRAPRPRGFKPAVGGPSVRCNN